MPKPHDGESRSDFVARCMSDEEAKRDHPEHEARLGFCEGMFNQHQKEGKKMMSAQYLSVQFHSLGASVDKEAKVLRGYVMAMEGEFVDGRGAFDRAGLKAIAESVNSHPKGLKSRWGHPSPFGDALGNFLGRAKNARVDTTLNREGKRVSAVRGDLHLDESSFHTPKGDIGGYLMRIAESDPDAISSSLVIYPKIEERGRGLAPLWFPEALRASDIVEEGAAVAGLLDDAGVLRGKLKEILDRAFEDEPEPAIKQFVEDYLSARFGQRPATPHLDAVRLRLDEIALTTRKLAR